MPPPIDRSGRKVPQLKKECSERGIKSTGRKAELIQRLADYDRNDDFRGAGPSLIIPDADAMPEWPSPTSFRSVTTADRDKMPKVKNIINRLIGLT